MIFNNLDYIRFVKRNPQGSDQVSLLHEEQEIPPREKGMTQRPCNSSWTNLRRGDTSSGKEGPSPHPVHQTSSNGTDEERRNVSKREDEIGSGRGREERR